MKRLDLHLHTTASDGRLEPEALVFKAAAHDLDAIAITDHDTTAGVAAALAEGHALGVRVLTGVELSVDLRLPGETLPLHLICLGFDLDDAPLQALLARTRAARGRAARETLERLSLAGYAAGIPARLLETVDRTVCRPHLADALVAAGHARDRQHAFQRFLAGEAYRTPYELPTAEDAIRVVHDAGGLVLWAHPHEEELDRAAPALADLGLDGLEAFRASRRAARSLYVEEVARHYGLLTGGGSDAHGGLIGEFVLTDDQAGGLVRELS